jgi:hypothetical protein
MTQSKTYVEQLPGNITNPQSVLKIISFEY